MARRRGDGPPGLIDRVRWGNVGRLAAVLAAGLLIAFGPGSCGSGGAKPATAPRGLLPDESAAGDQYGVDSQGQKGGDEGRRAGSPPVSDEEKKQKHERSKPEHKPDAPAQPRLAKQRPVPQSRPRYRSAPARRYYPRTRRYYSRPTPRYSAPAPRYTPPPEPPRGTPEFL